MAFSEPQGPWCKAERYEMSKISQNAAHRFCACLDNNNLNGRRFGCNTEVFVSRGQKDVVCLGVHGNIAATMTRGSDRISLCLQNPDDKVAINRINVLLEWFFPLLNHTAIIKRQGTVYLMQRSDEHGITRKTIEQGEWISLTLPKKGTK